MLRVIGSAAIVTGLSISMVIAWAVFVTVWVIGAFSTKRTVRRQSFGQQLRLFPIPLLVCCVLFVVIQYFGIADRRFVPRLEVYSWIGLVMTITGFAFAIWARVKLGRNWSGTVTVKQDHELIRTGPYALVRHPIYSGITFAVIGTVIFIGEVRGLVWIAAVVAGLILKLRTEEKFMTEQFGSVYTDYRQKTKALVPFVW